jgi:MFS family permease
VASAIGPFLGGWLVAAASWRLIFVINLPIAAAVVLVSLRHVPETEDTEATGRVDLVGGVLVTAGLVGVVYALIEGGVGVLALGLACLGGFLFWEARAAHPMLPLSLFRNVQFTATNLVTFVVYGALGGVLFLLPIQLQQVSGYSALQAGIALLPVTVIMLVLSARSGALAARIGPRLQMSVGPLIVGAGMALFMLVGVDGAYATRVLPAVVVLGLGLATTVAPLTTTVLAALPAHHSGMASAVNNDVARAAGLIAVAVLPAAAGLTGEAYLHPDAFSAGFHTAVLVCAALCVAGGALAALLIRNPARRPAPPVRHPYHCPLGAPPPAAAGRAPAGQSIDGSAPRPVGLDPHDASCLLRSRPQIPHGVFADTPWGMATVPHEPYPRGYLNSAGGHLGDGRYRKARGDRPARDGAGSGPAGPARPGRGPPVPAHAGALARRDRRPRGAGPAGDQGARRRRLAGERLAVGAGPGAGGKALRGYGLDRAAGRSPG